MDQDNLLVAVQGFREALQADHADLEPLGLEQGVARFRLLLGEETCQECILPKDVLEETLVFSLRQTMPEVRGVELDDPREAASG
ncbi:MAG: hypothetical protein GEV03_16295 [Streptosporangiales bacterium]|nr:hypothetical protein [Streptosporangiales bacterium]